MHTVIRNSKTLAIISAAAGLAASVQLAGAQTWINPNTGNWSVGANWVGGAAPVSGASTALTFNATGTQSYTATNNIANPFLLNAINFNNSGTGLVTVAGSQLSFTGTSPAINQNNSGSAAISNPLALPGANNHDGLTLSGTGAGTVTLSGALSSNPAAAGTSGAAMISDNPNARLVLNGGGTLYGLRANRGSMFVTGGIWELTSAQRGNDLFGAPDDGFWAVVAGNSGSGPGSITFSNGAKVNGRSAFAGNDPGQSGSLTFTDPGTVGTFNAGGILGRVGTNWGTGTFSIINGATVFSTRTDIGRNAGGIGTFLVNGANSTLNASNLDVAPDENTNSTAIISGGGKVVLTDGANSSAMAVGWATSLLGDNLQSTGRLTITGTGSSISVTTGAGQGSGQLGVAIGDPGVASVATISVDAGGHLDAENTFIGQGDGRAAMTVNGTGSNFVNRGQFLMESAVPSSLSVTNSGQWLSQGTNFTSSNAGDQVSITVSSNAVADLGANVTDSFVSFSGGGGAGVAGGTTTITINTGGEMKANLISAATNPNSRTDLNVDGANSKLTIAGADAQLVLGNDNGAVANLNVTNGGRASIGANGAAFLSAGTTSVAIATISGAGSQFDASASGAQLQVGGSGTLALGAASFNVVNNASASVGDLTVVFTPGVINIGSGTTKASFTSGTGGTVVDGTINFNAGTFNSVGTLDVGGRVLLSSAARNAAGTPSNKKLLEAGSATLTSSGVIDLNDNDALFHSGTRQKYENFVKAARNNGLWDQPGITSTAAKNAVPKNKNLGVLSGTEYLAVNGTPFNGKTVVAGDTVIKFTFNGDTDFNGVVNFDDYARTDSGFNNGRSGWLNGDFDYNGIVNFDDYSLIDNAFNTQGATVLSSGTGGLAGPANITLVSAIDQTTGAISMVDTNFAIAVRPVAHPDHDGNLQAVPEPGALAFIGLGTLGAIRRRHRRQP